MIWRRYIEERERRLSSSTQKVVFRDKKRGWKKYSILFEYSNNLVYENLFYKDLFMRAFFSNLCLRPSCYACSFKGIKREADITLADFWGIDKVLPDFDDDKGTSLVLMNSPKGIELLNSISSDRFICKEIDSEVVAQYNPSGIMSCKLNPKREMFFEEIKNADFEKTLQRYTKESLYRRICNFMDRFIVKIKS